MNIFDGWDTRVARAHLVFLILLVVAGRLVVFAGRDRLPHIGPDGIFLPAPSPRPLPLDLSEREKWIWGLPMDLARVSEEDLRRIPGVGPDLARKIMAWMRKNGVPSTIEGLRAVKGVGPGRIKTLEQYMVVGKGGSARLTPPVPVVKLARIEYSTFAKGVQCSK